MNLPPSLAPIPSGSVDRFLAAEEARMAPVVDDLQERIARERQQEIDDLVEHGLARDDAIGLLDSIDRAVDAMLMRELGIAPD